LTDIGDDKTVEKPVEYLVITFWT